MPNELLINDLRLLLMELNELSNNFNYEIYLNVPLSWVLNLMKTVWNSLGKPIIWLTSFWLNCEQYCVFTTLYWNNLHIVNNVYLHGWDGDAFGAIFCLIMDRLCCVWFKIIIYFLLISDSNPPMELLTIFQISTNDTLKLSVDDSVKPPLNHFCLRLYYHNTFKVRVWRSKKPTHFHSFCHTQITSINLTGYINQLYWLPYLCSSNEAWSQLATIYANGMLLQIKFRCLHIWMLINLKRGSLGMEH